MEDVLSCYETFLKRAFKKESCKIIHICLNPEFFQRQKLDLVSRTMFDNKYLKDVKYICIGSVKNELSLSALFNFKMREKYFKYSAEQRQIISDDLSDQNIRSLTLFSFYFDLFSTSHQTDIKNFKVIDLDQLDFFVHTL